MKPLNNLIPMRPSAITLAILSFLSLQFELKAQTINASATCGNPTTVSYSISYSGTDNMIGASWSIYSGSGSLTDNGSTAIVDWTTTGTVKLHYILQEPAPSYATHEDDTYSTYIVYTAGTASYSWSRCYNSAGTLSLSGGTSGVTTVWQKCTSGCSSTDDTGWTTTTNTFSNLAVSTYFRAKVTSSTCGTKYSNTLSVPPVYSEFHTGTVYQPSTGLCSNQAITIYTQTASGGNGTPLYQWQEKIGSSFYDIYDEDDYSYTISANTIPVGGSRTYRRLAKPSVSCPSSWVASNEVTVTVNGSLSSGTLQPQETICSGTSPGLIVGSAPSGGGGGYQYEWRVSTDGASWGAVVATTDSYDPPGNISLRTYYKRTVTSSCGGSAYSTTDVDVGTTAPGSITNYPSSACYDSGTSGSFSISGNSGPVTWQQCTTDCSNSSNWSNLGSNVFGPLSITTQFRAKLNSELCGVKYTPVVTFNINPGQASTQPLSGLYNASATLTATGANANETYKWYNSADTYIQCTGNCPTPVLKDATSFTYYATVVNTVSGCETPYSQKAPLVINLYLNPPPAPIISANSCGPKTVTMPELDEVTWYWQGTNATEQLTNQPVDPSYTFNTSGPFYIRGKADGASLWTPALKLSEESTAVDAVDITMTSYEPNTTLVQATHSITLSASGGGFVIPAGSTFAARIEISAECNDLVNWTESIAYDQAGVPIASSKSYYDGLGKSLLDESKDYLSKKIFASQPLYDTYGVAVAATMPAPIQEHDFIYKNNFARNEADQPYSSADFDLRTTTNVPESGEINYPKPVGEQPGTVGWYYSSNNNFEPNTPVTDYPYSRSFAQEGPNPTTSKSAGAGDAHRMGSGHEVSSERQLIGANDLNHYLSLRNHFVSSSLPLTGYKYVTTDPDGKKVVSFQDADGRTLASATLDGSTFDNWSYSYYNDVGQLVASVAPNGVNTGSSAYPQFVTIYEYDHLGRMIETTSPDEGTSQFVYSTDGKIRFSRNAVQAAAGKFSYTNYDYLGRLIESGEYTSGSYIFEPHSITTAPATNSILNIVDEVGQSTGISRKITAQQSYCSDYTFIEYDQENFAEITPPPASFQTNLNGQVSRTENENAITLYSYDEFGQVIKTWQLIKVTEPDIVKTVDYSYDYFGNVTEVAYQKGNVDDAFYHHYVYDVNQRLTEVLTSKNGINKTSRAKYEYYLHGPLKRVALANGADELQGIDYTYTINGALKTINHADAAMDPGADGNDVFGETLQYFDNDYEGANYSAGVQTIGGHNNQYSGLLKAMSWHSPAGNHEKQTYGYTYDNRNQLANAVWGPMTGASGVYGFTAASPQSYREAVPGYDKNGNIQSLIRNDKLGDATANYGYVYEANTNKLDKVNHNSSILIDYSYNAIGQMIRQVEGTKDIEIVYNAYGLTKELRDNNNSDNLVQSYHYDDRGNLLQKVTYIGGVAELYTTYISDVAGNVLAIYQQGSVALAAEPVEIPIYGAGRFAVYKPGSETYFYEVSDHLGNVRAVIGTAATETYSTNLESATNGDFLSYDPHYDDLMDHTDASDVYKHSQLLNGGYAGRIGPTKSLAISPGDVIKVEAYGKYRGFSGTGPNLDGFAAALTAAFGLVSGAPGDPGMAYSAMDDYGQLIAGGFDDHHEDVNAPKGFLNILLFDKSFNLVDAAFQQIDVDYVQIDEVVKADHQYLMREVTVTEPGYAYIFFSNEDQTLVDIHFDDVMVTHTHSNIVAGADYYPYGLAMEGREIGDEPYRYGYQGQFSEKDLTTGMQEFELRMYDPRIGRWLSPDPYGQFASPYLGMANTPNMSIDPDGGMVPITPQAINFIEFGVQELLASVTVTATSIARSSVPIPVSGVAAISNRGGGQIFVGTDGGTYSAVPTSGGAKYYMNVDDQWKLIRDDGAIREQYARDLLDLHRVLAGINATLISGGIGGSSFASRAVISRNAVNTTLNSAATGSTSAARLSTNGIKLNQQLASEAQMAERGITILRNLKVGQELARRYGGNAADWVKKSSSSFTKNGKTFETHWYENVVTGLRVEFKTKLVGGW